MDTKDPRRESNTSCDYVQQMRSISTSCALLELIQQVLSMDSPAKTYAVPMAGTKL